MASNQRPTRADQIYEHRSHINHKAEEIESAIKNMHEGNADPVGLHWLIEETIRRFVDQARNMDDQEVDVLAGKTIREAQKKLIEKANKKKARKEKRNQKSGGGGKPQEKEKTPVEKMTEAIERNRQAQIAQGNTALAGAPSPQAVRHNPWLAFKAAHDQKIAAARQQPTSQPGRLRRFGGKVKQIFRGGNIRNGRTSRPTRRLMGRLTRPFRRNAPPPPTPPKPNAAVNTMLAAIQKNKAAQSAQQGKNPPISPFAPKDPSKTTPPPFGPRKPFIPIPPEYFSADDSDDDTEIVEQPDFDNGGRGHDVVGNQRADTAAAQPNYADAPGPSNRPSAPDDDDDDDNGGGDDDQDNNSGNNDNNRHARPRRGRKLPKKLARGGGSAAKSVANAGKAIRIAVTVGRFVLNPYVGIPLLILLILILLIAAISGFLEQLNKAENERCRGQAGETLQVEKTGPPKGINGQTLVYTFTIKDVAALQELTIVDRIPQGISLNPADVQSSWLKYVIDPTTRTITWKATENVLPQSLTAPNMTFTLNLKATADNQHLIYVVESTPQHAGAGGADGKPVIALDPGHGGEVPEYKDTVTGLGDRETPNTPEREDVQDVATRVKTILEPAGYSVILLKQGAADVVSKRDRVNAAVAANAKLAISIHTTADPGFNQVWPQYIGGFRALQNDSVRVEFTNQQVATESDRIAGIMAEQRTQTEGHAVIKTTDQTLSFGRPRGLPSYGNISLVQLWSPNIPWVYNEIGQDNGAAISEGRKQAYAEGIANGVKIAMPATPGQAPVQGGTLPGCAPGGPGGPPNLNAADFEALVRGQGRNTQILGDENNFVNTLMRNGGDDFAGKEQQLRALYQNAIQRNVNPLIMATIWGVEAGFRVNGTEFGCKPFHSGFEAQVGCSARTLDNKMSEFEKSTQRPFPHPVEPVKCTFDDAFIYAYERYTPVCAINDSNGNARKNFVSHFKKLYGEPVPPPVIPVL